MAEPDPNQQALSSVLILLSTGKLGSGVVDAFAAANRSGDYPCKIFGTSRNSQHPKLLAKDVMPIAFVYGDKTSIDNALQLSQADIVVMITSSLVSKSKEVEHGKLILDACQEHSIPHVILASCDWADVAPKKAGHMSSKKTLEVHLQQQQQGSTSWSVLRPSSFWENFDDPSVMNPLCRGSLKDLYDERVQVNHVATLDVGKAAVAMAQQPAQWNGKILTCITSRDTGEALAAVLAEVSGVPCTYQATPPRLILKYILTDLYHMVELCRSKEEMMWTKEINEFQQVVPDAMDFSTWLKTQQKGWSDGTLFGDPAPKRSFSETLLSPSSVVIVFSSLGAILAAIQYGRI